MLASIIQSFVAKHILLTLVRILTLLACVFRNEARPIDDTCILCPEGKYLLTKSFYVPEQGKGSLWSPSALNASNLCDDCPGV